MTGIASIVFGVLLCAASVFTFRRRSDPQTGRNMRAGSWGSVLSWSDKPFSAGRAGATAVAGFILGALIVVYGAATL